MSIYTPTVSYPYTTSAYYGYQGYGRPAANQWVPRQSYYSTSPSAQFAPPLGSFVSSASPILESVASSSVAQAATGNLLPKLVAGLAGAGALGGSVFHMLKGKKSTPAANDTDYIPPKRVLATGAQLNTKGPAGANFKNVLFITTQRSVVQGGGLGQYCTELPQAMNRMGFDVRSVSPYDAFEYEEDSKLPAAQQSTVVGEPYKVSAGQDEYTLILRKRFNPETQGWLYLVQCDDLFVKEQAEAKLAQVKTREYSTASAKGTKIPKKAKTKVDTSVHTYSGGNSGPGMTAKPVSAEADPTKMISYLNMAAKHFLFDQKLAKDKESLIPEAKSTSWEPEVIHENEFSGSEISGQFTREQRAQYAKGYVLHNQHDGVSQMANILKLGLNIPEGMENSTQYSRANVGIHFADVVFASEPYARRLAQGQGDWQKSLARHLEKGTVINTYHGATNPVPVSNPDLEAHGLASLPSHFVLKSADPSQMYSAQQLTEIQKFKGAHNKVAFQRLYPKGWESNMSPKLKLKPSGYFKEDPQAVMYTMVSRIDPYQKGWLNAINTLKDFMKKNPHAQLFLAGAANHDPQIPILQRQLDKLTKDPELEGRVVAYTDWIKGKTIDHAMTASDFDIHPSLFEPFGMHNLRVNQWASIPLLRHTDGLAVTGYDPDFKGANGYESIAKPFGQTCLFAPAINHFDQQFAILDKIVAATKHLTAGQNKPKGILTAPEKAILAESNRTLREVLDRSMALAKDPNQKARVMLQGLNYVYTKHYMWEDVVRTVYIPAYNDALLDKQPVQAKKQKKVA